jgi:putative RNA 2'-phosphotransferase
MEDRSSEKKLRGYSKFLSYVLRHSPGEVGLALDGGGWVDVGVLLKKCRDHRRARGLDRELLDVVVATNNKKRFEYSEDGRKIRARQGHSVPVDLGHDPVEPPECLYHGTSRKFYEPIRSGGLLKMSRHAVHLSRDYATAVDVGSRRGKPVVLKVRALQMHSDGYRFFLTENGVWYTERVPVDYLLWPEDRAYWAIGETTMPTPDLRES